MTLSTTFIAICLLLAVLPTQMVSHNTNCSDYRDHLTHLITSTEKCFSAYSRPFYICRNCRSIYSQTKTFYTEFHQNSTHIEGNVTSDRSCYERVMASDVVSVLTVQLVMLDEIWTNAKCKNCYKNPDDLTAADLNNDTLNYFAFYAELRSCLELYTSHSSFPEFGDLDVNWDPSDYNHTVCVTCQQHYNNLNQFYRNVGENVSYKEMCMDVVDSMNYTSRAWWYLYRCQPTETDYLPLLPLGLSVLGMTVFYILMASSCCRSGPSNIQIYREKRVRLRRPTWQPASSNDWAASSGYSINSMAHTPNHHLEDSDEANLTFNASNQYESQGFASIIQRKRHSTALGVH